jgi:hypothetical protein
MGRSLAFLPSEFKFGKYGGKSAENQNSANDR